MSMFNFDRALWQMLGWSPARCELELAKLQREDNDLATRLRRALAARCDWQWPELIDPCEHNQGSVPEDRVLKPGVSVAGFELRRVLGRGAIGTVYQAYDRELNRDVALKVINAGDAEQARRFKFEAESQARIDHPNVVKVYRTGEWQGRLYIAMQWVDGGTFAQLTESVNIDERVGLLLQLARAAQAAHAKGLLHRDIKPSNGLWRWGHCGRRVALLADFGIARAIDAPDITQTGVIVGTPHYLPPERVGEDERQPDLRSDVYALGATLYFLLAGRPPVTGHSTWQVLWQLIHRDPISVRRLVPSLHHDLALIVMKALARDPQQRYPDAGALADDLERYLSARPVRARPPALLYRLSCLISRHRLLATICALAAVIITTLSLAFAIHSLAQQRQLSASATLAESVSDFTVQMLRDMKVAHDSGTPVQADELLARAQQRLGLRQYAPELKAKLYQILAEIYNEFDQYDRAGELVAKADSVYSEPASLARSRLIRAVSSQYADLNTEAFAWASEARQILANGGLTDQLIFAQVIQAQLYSALKINHSSVESLLADAVRTATRHSEQEQLLAAALISRGLWHMQYDRWSDAEHDLQAAYAIEQSIADNKPAFIPSAPLVLGRLAIRRQHIDQARLYLTEFDQYTELMWGPDQPHSVNADYHLGLAECEFGDPARGLAHLQHVNATLINSANPKIIPMPRLKPMLVSCAGPASIAR